MKLATIALLIITGIVFALCVADPEIRSVHRRAEVTLPSRQLAKCVYRERTIDGLTRSVKRTILLDERSNMKLKEYFTKSGLGYRQIGERTRPQLSEAQVFQCVNNQWRVTLMSFMAVAAVLGMPDEEARDEWALEKANHHEVKIYKEAGRPRPAKRRYR